MWIHPNGCKFVQVRIWLNLSNRDLRGKSRCFTFPETNPELIGSVCIKFWERLFLSVDPFCHSYEVRQGLTDQYGRRLPAAITSQKTTRGSHRRSKKKWWPKPVSKTHLLLPSIFIKFHWSWDHNSMQQKLGLRSMCSKRDRVKMVSKPRTASSGNTVTHRRLSDHIPQGEKCLETHVLILYMIILWDKCLWTEFWNKT